ncbi:hypothetical protein Pa4123_86270 [Phytohabitans aurantiacus]|uniref:HTH cro/C1-type domain-containing protein n=1 Tax=Phytohabitans aurantiacus TaxID=3016789 RepID=A0ABQ5R9B4_9ACTN|nr:hypothetical protein Pa4123_86270 [Phytohabitans aurantiacus]
MKWNLRLVAANKGIWKSTEMRRLLAEAGLEISAGKMSALWTTTPTTIRLDDLDVMCAVLQCTPADLLLPEPEKVAARRPQRPSQAATGSDASITPRPGHATGMTGRPKPCRVCRVRPPAMREISYCFQCWPGGPVRPPPATNAAPHGTITPLASALAATRTPLDNARPCGEARGRWP